MIAFSSASLHEITPHMMYITKAATGQNTKKWITISISQSRYTNIWPCCCFQCRNWLKWLNIEFFIGRVHVETPLWIYDSQQISMILKIHENIMPDTRHTPICLFGSYNVRTTCIHSDTTRNNFICCGSVNIAAQTTNVTRSLAISYYRVQYNDDQIQCIWTHVIFNKMLNCGSRYMINTWFTGLFHNQNTARFLLERIRI